PAKQIVDVAQPVEVHVENRYVGAESDGDPGGVDAGRAGADDHDVARRNTRHAREQDAPAAVGAAQVERALLDREAPGDLAHGREERKAPVRTLDRLVGDGDGPGGEKSARQLR